MIPSALPRPFLQCGSFCLSTGFPNCCWTPLTMPCLSMTIVARTTSSPLNNKRGRTTLYKNDFRLAYNGIPICMAGLKMRYDGVEASKHRSKFRCPLMNCSTGTCSCATPCSHSKFERTVHLAKKGIPRLINIPPRNSEAWKTEYVARTFLGVVQQADEKRLPPQSRTTPLHQNVV